MSSQQSAERIEQRTDRAVGPAMWVGLVAWVVVIALICTLVPAIRRLFENHAVPTSVIVALITIAGGMASYMFFAARAEREADRAAQVEPTPASHWASANGCTYQFRAETPGEALLASAGINTAAPYVLDMVKGQVSGRSIWAFTSARSDTQSVVMKLKLGWPGELTITRADDAVAKTRAAAHIRAAAGKQSPAVQADGCEVVGDITGGGSAEVADLLSGAGFLAAVTVADLPAGAIFGAWYDDDHIGVQVAWADDPDAVMPVALPLLAKLAEALEADAAKTAAE